MALNLAQLMQTPGGPGVVGAVKAGSGISISSDGTISSNLTGFLPLTGGTLTGTLVLPNGGKLNPSLQFSGSIDSGLFYNPSTSGIGISTKGKERFIFDDTGQELLGDPKFVTSASSPFSAACQSWTAESSEMGPAFLTVRATNNTSIQPGGFITRRCRGSNPFQPQPVQPNDSLGQFWSYGAVGNDWNSITAASITIKSGVAQNTNSQIVFGTDSDITSSFSLTEWVRLGPSGQWGPVTDNSNNLGLPTARWKALYVVNSPYVGIDASQISQTPLGDELGLDFINALTPVAYVPNVEYNEVVGEPINPNDPEMDWVFENEVTPVSGSTVHWGVTPQNLAAVQSSLGLTGNLGCYDTGGPGEPGWVAPDELVAPLIKAVQQLTNQVAYLQSQIDALTP